MVDKLIAIGAIKQEGNKYILVDVETGEVYGKNASLTSIDEIETYIKSHLYVRTCLKKLLKQY